MTSESLDRTDTESNPLLASTSYEIDPALNYKSITNVIQSARTTAGGKNLPSVNARNEYTSFGGQSLTYDRNGNLTSIDGSTLQYDADNHLARAVSASGAVVENTFDALGRKVQESVTAGGSTRIAQYVLRGDDVLETYVNDTLAERYVRGRGTDEIVRVEIGGTPLFPLQDELGNVERLTGANGATVERYQYDGYGKFTMFGPDNSERTSSAFGWRWLFQGREYNSILSAYDFRARTLWPELGRFGQEDPLGTADSINLYDAFRGSPVANTDPSGMTILDHVHGFFRHRAYNNAKAAMARGPLAAMVWNAFDTSASFSLEFTAVANANTSAETTRHYDANGDFTSATIALGDNFGMAPTGPAAFYGHGQHIYATDPDDTAHWIYTVGHELGHVMFGFPPSTFADARLFEQQKGAFDALDRQRTPIVRIPVAQRTAAQQQLLNQLNQQMLAMRQEAIHDASEFFADSTGETLYFDYRTAHPARGIHVQRRSIQPDALPPP
jgi:RHS repeat-associated protein